LVAGFSVAVTRSSWSTKLLYDRPC